MVAKGCKKTTLKNCALQSAEHHSLILTRIISHVSRHHRHANCERAEIFTGHLIRVGGDDGKISVAADRECSKIFFLARGECRARSHHAKSLIDVDALVAIPAAFWLPGCALPCYQAMQRGDGHA